jgi:aminotransferase
MIDQAMENSKTEQIAMWVADPGFPTDKRIKEAFDFAVEKGCTHYFPAKGFDENILPKAIARYYENTRGAQIDPLTQVKVTHGAQEALSFSLHVSVKPGDEVIVPEPTYSALIEKLPIFGAKTVFVPLIEKDNWRLDTDAIKSKITEKTKAIFICNPNNPTGIVYSKKEIEDLSNILRENKHVSILLDECYSRILYDGTEFFSLIDDDTVRNQLFLVNSFSKAYAMTGWRLGYVISGKEKIDKIKSLAFEYNGGVSYAVQYAGAVALDRCSSFVESMVEELAKRRKVMLQHLAEIKDVTFENPKGGFELFPNFGAYTDNSVDLSTKLEQEINVKTIPGSRFGPSGEKHLRLVFCSENNSRIAEGMSRMKSFFSTSRISS